MHSESVDLRRGIITGILAGGTWGWVALIVNAVSGAFPYEGGLLHNLITFTLGGAVLGVVAGAFLNLLQAWLPFKNIISSAVFISSSLWVILRVGGTFLSSACPARYHLVTAQTVQGLMLSVMLGLMLGLFWRTIRNLKGNRA
ncbi:MAG: hypothetical protein HZA08_03315 [Nitrospirae bacterium]|nr:hypothetical protein [Nitrospirota bacterium]